jgi:hypothetical protein
VTAAVSPEFTLQEGDELRVEVDVQVFTAWWNGDIGPVEEDRRCISGSFERACPSGTTEIQTTSAPRLRLGHTRTSP